MEKWFVLTKEQEAEEWQILSHPSGTPFRYQSVDKTIGIVKGIRKSGKLAMAVKESLIKIFSVDKKCLAHIQAKKPA